MPIPLVMIVKLARFGILELLLSNYEIKLRKMASQKLL